MTGRCDTVAHKFERPRVSVAGGARAVRSDAAPRDLNGSFKEGHKR